MNHNTLIGLIAGLLTSSSSLPQLIKIIRTKKVEDVSLLMLIVLMTGVSIWMYYGFLIEDLPIILTNGFSLLLTTISIFFRIKYKKKD